MTKEELQKEFNRQVENLIQKGYPEAAKLTQEAFIEEIESLRSKLEGLLLGELDLDKGYIPFVIVVSHMLVATDVAMSLVIKDGKEGVTKLFPLEPKDFSVIDAVEVPPYDFYLVNPSIIFHRCCILIYESCLLIKLYIFKSRRILLRFFHSLGKESIE